MRLTIIIHSLLFLASCRNSSLNEVPDFGANNYKTTIVPLDDSLGTIAITIPERYDTSFSWIDSTDCGRSGGLTFRFQPKNLEILKETCWSSPVYLWIPNRVRSIDRLTLKYQTEYLQLGKITDSMFIYQFHQILKADSDISDATPFKIVLDTVEKIDNHYFSILAFEISDSIRSRFTKTLSATTLINGDIIQLGYEWFSQQNNLKIDEFIDASKFYLKRTHFNNNK